MFRDKDFVIETRYCGIPKIIQGRENCEEFVAFHKKFFNTPEDKAARQAKRVERFAAAGKHIHINRHTKKVIVNGKENVSEYKGQVIYDLGSLVKYFTNSADSIEKHISQGKYNISKCKISIDSVDVKTASNGYEPRDTIPANGEKPIEKDTVSTSDSKDRFVWYNINATIDGVKIQTGWLCWYDYDNAGYAARYGACDVSFNVDSYAVGVARALEQVYFAHLAKTKS